MDVQYACKNKLNKLLFKTKYLRDLYVMSYSINAQAYKNAKFIE